MRLGYLWLPHFPVQAARHRRPELRERPLLITDDPGGLGRVVDAGPDCLARGVTLGMPAGTAAGLLGDPVVLPREPTLDAELFERALACLERFADGVEPRDEGAWFAPAAPARSPLADERRLGIALVEALAASLGLEARVGVADGRFAACVAAQHRPKGSEPVAIVPPGGAAGFLAPLPITLLPLGPRSVDKLLLLGVRTAGAFARLPTAPTVRRFGREATLALDLARGRDAAPFRPRTLPESRELRHRFEPPIEDREVLFAAVVGLVEGPYRFRSLRLTLEDADGRAVERSVELRAPTSDPERWRAVLRAMVDELAPGGPVACVAVRLGAISRALPEQTALFAAEGAGAERGERVRAALAEVERRYRGRVRRVVPGDVPESLFHERRLLLLPAPPEGDEHGEPPRDLATPAVRARPVRLAARGTRLYLALPDGRDELVALYGRWEAEDWWPEARRRTYYRARTRRGLILTLALDRSGEAGRWWLVERLD